MAKKTHKPKPAKARIHKVTSYPDINRRNRLFWVLQPALEKAGLDASEMQATLEHLILKILDIEAEYVSEQSARGGEKEALRKELNAPEWRAPVAARADEIKLKHPKWSANQIAEKICDEDKIPGLPSHRRVADFLRAKFRMQAA